MNNMYLKLFLILILLFVLLALHFLIEAFTTKNKFGKISGHKFYQQQTHLIILEMFHITKKDYLTIEEML